MTTDGNGRVRPESDAARFRRRLKEAAATAAITAAIIGLALLASQFNASEEARSRNAQEQAERRFFEETMRETGYSYLEAALLLRDNPKEGRGNRLAGKSERRRGRRTEGAGRSGILRSGKGLAD